MRETFLPRSFSPPCNVCGAAGEVFCDAWLFLLLTTLSICHYNANLQSLKSLKESLHEKDLANQELKRMTQAKSQFLADITHGKPYGCLHTRDGVPL